MAAIRIAPTTMLTGLIATTVIAYAVQSVSWVVHEVRGGAWARWLELTYLTALVVWLGSFLVVLLVRKRLSRRSREPLSDERTAELFLRAHRVALIVVLLAQIPFFFVQVPANVVAQVTATTAVVALFASYAWLDR
jgi:hypothetical protein